jgi:hypothetical protein
MKKAHTGQSPMLRQIQREESRRTVVEAAPQAATQHAGE